VQDHLDDIRALAPDLTIDKTDVRTEGQSNDVVIVNDEHVFRFAKSDAAAADLDREMKVLSVLPKHVALAVPESSMPRPGVMRQRVLPGASLDRATLLRQPIKVQERLVEQLATFLYELHRVPTDALAGVGKSGAGERAFDAVVLFHDCERLLFPHMKSYACDVVREHFEPVLNGQLTLAFEPVLIHADLNPSHVLWDADRGVLTGVIDFGMSGLGDSAYDYASILLGWGEGPLWRMHAHHDSIGAKIDRARFWASAIELRLALAGLESGDPKWFCATLGFARDALPIGSAWLA
jgi:aminoglycoside 2''-phosphotransferase